MTQHRHIIPGTKSILALGAAALLSVGAPAFAGGHLNAVSGVADAVGGAAGGSGHGGGNGSGSGSGGGISASVGGGFGSGNGAGTSGSIDVAIGGASDPANLANPRGTANTITRAAKRNRDAQNRASQAALRLEDLVGYRVVDVRGQQLGLVQAIDKNTAGMFAVRLSLVSSMPRDQAVVRFSELKVSSEEVRLPISKRALRQSLQ